MTDQKGNKKLRSLLISCGLILVGFALMLIVLTMYAFNLLPKPEADLDTPVLEIKTNGSVSELLFTHDGQGLLSHEAYTSVHLRSVSDGKIIQSFRVDGGRIVDLALHPSKPWFAASAENGLIWLWDYQTGQLLHTFTVQVGIIYLAFSPNGEYLAADVWDYEAKFNYTGVVPYTGALYIWQIPDFALLHEIKLLEPYNTIAFSFDSKQLITGASTITLRIWDVADGELLKEAKGYHGVPYYWNVVPTDNPQIMYVHNRNVIELWTQQGDYLDSFLAPLNGFCSFAISKDSQSIATGSCDSSYRTPNPSFDKSIRLWNTTDASLFQTIKAHEIHITALAFSPDRSLFASGSQDRTIKIWRVVPDTAAP